MGANEEGTIEPSEVNLKEVTFLEMGKFPDRAAKQGAGYRVIEGQDLTEFQVFKRDGSAQYTVIIDVTDAKVCKAKVFCSCPQWVQRGFHEAEACKHLHMVFWAAIAKRGIIKQVVEVVPYKLTQEPGKLGSQLRQAAQAHQTQFHEASTTSADGIHRDLTEYDEKTALAPIDEPPITALAVPNVEQAIAYFEAFSKLKSRVLNKDDVVDIKGQLSYKKTAFHKLARVFNLSLELYEEVEHTDSNGRPGWKFTVVARHPSGACAFGVGSCYHDEPRAEKGLPDHFVRAKAYTRAEKRAIDAILGGGVPPAEED